MGQIQQSSGEINFLVADPAAVIARVEAELAPGAVGIDRLDGLTLSFPDWRLNLRASNTEPLLPLNVESRGDVAILELAVSEVSALILAT